ncbi:MAG: beta-ketoacyl synthase [Cyanobium sp.]|nr:MAG: beta-ketoacyl synthase [Cyanobium sp.]
MSNPEPHVPRPPEPIAIVGIGCRLPGEVDSPADFWQLLIQGRDVIREVPSDRWDLARHFDPDPQRPLHQHVRHGGFIEAIDQFDAAFFGISPREAICMDPQQRLLLEVAWRALEDGGQPVEAVRGQAVGVFIGISSADYINVLWSSTENYAVPDNEPFVLPGNTSSIAANRLSYFFDFKGPSFSVDTACSSSLVAVHLACESLWRGEAVAALAGGVQALISPGSQMGFCKAGLLSADGRCKSFDASADGYVRSEGAGVVLLKPLSAALANGDAIYALIQGTAVNSDGRSNGMVAPNLQSQVICVRQAFARAGIDPAAAQYVEAHGTGTRQGDPVELQALGTVLGEGRPHDQPCRVGSVKSNLGHGETVAGITGLIKAALCVHHRQLPASLHCRNPNPDIDFSGLKLQVQTSLEPFPQADRPAVVGVSSFGFGGTNAHDVLGEPPEPAAASSRPRPPRPLPLQLLCLSAHSDVALRQKAGDLASLLRDQPGLPLVDLCATANQRRSQLSRRLVCLAPDHAALLLQLAGFAAGEEPQGISWGQAARRPGKLAFLFTGQGSQTLGMAEGLLRHHPVFRAAFEACTHLLDPLLPQPLARVLYPAAGLEEAAASALNQTRYTQPALFVVGYALAQLWQSWGVRPDLLMGHSVGEVVAAHLAGVFSLEDAIRLVVARGRLMQELPAGGGMLALLATADQLDRLLQQHPELTVAASNGPANTVLSGPLKALDRLELQAQAQGLAVHRLAVSHAFHSPAMAPMLDAFAKELAQLRFHPPRQPLVSNLTGRLAGEEIAHPSYWCDHLIRPVKFARGMDCLAAQGAQTFLEIGARPTLTGMGRQCLPDPALTWLPSLRPGLEDVRVMLSSLAQLHLQGHRVDWIGFHRPFPHHWVDLPGYPFQRQRFWWPVYGQTKEAASLWLDQLLASPGEVAARSTPSLSDDGQMRRLDLPGGREQRFETVLRADQPADLADHALRRQVVFPATGFLIVVLQQLQEEGVPLAIKGMELERSLKLRHSPLRLQLVISEGPSSRTFEFHSLEQADSGPGPVEAERRWSFHGGGLLPGSGDPDPAPFEPCACPATAAAVDLSGFYAALERIGLVYGPSFRGVVGLRQELGQAWAELVRPPGARDWALLDACLQVVAATLDPAAAAGQVFLPVGFDRLWLARLPLPDRLQVQVQLVANDEAAFVEADLLLLDPSLAGAEAVIGWIAGFRLRRLPRQALDWLFPLPEEAGSGGESPADWLYQSVWTSLAPEPQQPTLQPLPLRSPQAPWLVGAVGEQAAGFQAWTAQQGGEAGRLDLGETVPGPGPVLFWPDLRTLSVQEALEGLLVIAQQLGSASSRTPQPRRMMVVLEGEGPAQGALEAFSKTAALEQPQLGWSRLRLPEDRALAPGPADWPLLWELAEREAAILWQDGAARVERLMPLPADRFRWAIASFGSLETLWAEPVAAQEPAPGEVLLAVAATGLNFRDVLNALGLLRTYSRQLGLDEEARVPFGGECVGQVVACGEGVARELIGQTVVAALAVGSLASHVCCRAELVVPLPAAMTPEVGASVTTAFLTAHYGLVDLAGLQPGETVLIHAAAGGVGQAALQVARRCGARILATASAAKQEQLLAQGVAAVFDSRSLAFAEQVLEHTGGRGVDVVLNSLKGDGVEAGFRALARGGRFIELGKIETWSRQQARDRRPDARYLPFDLLEVAAASPGLIRGLLLQLIEQLGNGQLTPLPVTVFPNERSVEAFRLMAQARHTGKVVISQPPRPPALRVDGDGAYLVSGALGGIGRQLLPWLADQGAKELVLVSRSLADPPPPARALMESLERRGVRLHCLAVDLMAADAADRLRLGLNGLERPVRGFFHAAGRLDDGLIDRQTPARLAEALAVKHGGWNAIEAALASQPLDFGVAFSSMASLLGSPGQSSYAAANGALDAACRAARGHRLSIQWGPWQGEGMAAAMAGRDRQRLRTLGVALLPPAACLLALERLLNRSSRGSVAVLNINWERLLRQAPRGQRALLANLLAGGAPGASSPGDAGPPALLAVLQATPAIERQAVLRRFVQEQLAKVLGLAEAEQIDASEPLFNMGLDSLMALEFNVLLEKNLGVSLSESLVFEKPTVDDLVNHFLMEVLFLTESSPQPAVPEPLETVASNLAWDQKLEEVAALPVDDLVRQLRGE